MAAHPPALTIRRDFPRADSAQLAVFSAVPTGFIVDANGRRGALSHGIRPITKAASFVGTALTVLSRARDNLAPYVALEYARPGDVLVIATGDYEEASVMGDISVGMARNRGVVAVITDGMVRDVEGLNATGIPVFARGVTPNSPFKDGPGEIGLSVSIGGVTVVSGDIVRGDGDGIVVIPRGEAARVIAELDEVKAKEAKMDKAVADGVGVPDWVPEALRTKGVRWVE